MRQVFEPQAVAAARAILADQEPPSDVLLPEVSTDDHIWEGFASKMRGAAKERQREIYLGPTRNLQMERDFVGYERPRLRLYLIEEAIRETFVLLGNIDRNVAPRLNNMNLVYGFTDVLLREMEALLTEWDELRECEAVLEGGGTP